MYGTDERKIRRGNELVWKGKKFFESWKNGIISLIYKEEDRGWTNNDCRHSGFRKNKGVTDNIFILTRVVVNEL